MLQLQKVEATLLKLIIGDVCCYIKVEWFFDSFEALERVFHYDI